MLKFVCMHAAQADATAASADDKASAAKNLGVAHRRQVEGQATLEGRMRAHIAALRHFATAFTFGTLCKGTQWCVRPPLCQPLARYQRVCHAAAVTPWLIMQELEELHAWALS